jgi:uncharacterized protein
MTPREKAEEGLALLKEAIVEVLGSSVAGLHNAEIADQLNIRSDYLGKQKDYLSWSLLGLLLNERRVERHGDLYTLPSSPPV